MDNNDLTLRELSADIRNKLQTAVTALELLRNNNNVPKEYIEKAIRDLDKVVKVIS